MTETKGEYMLERVMDLEVKLTDAYADSEHLRADYQTLRLTANEQYGQLVEARMQLQQAQAYADKLAAGLPMLPKDVELIRDANAGLAQEVHDLQAELASLREWQTQAREVMREVEWVDELDKYGDAHGCCPVCHGEHFDGHAPGCKLAVLLLEAK